MELKRDRFGRQLMALLLASILLAPHAGCVSALATAMYILKGSTVPAEFEVLKGKRVAVVCRPLGQLEYNSSGSATAIADRLGTLLSGNLRKVEVINQEKVDEWCDENPWNEFTEIGDALNADLVIGIDLVSFRLRPSQTLFQGQADVVVKVYDMSKDGDVTWQKSLPTIKYPLNSVIDSPEMLEEQFRKLFVAEIAEQIGKSFYPHDAHADLARSS